MDIDARAWQDAFLGSGHNILIGDIRAQIGKGGDPLMPMFLSKADVKAFDDELEEHRRHLLRERSLSQVEAFPGVRALFERLQDTGIRVALASSAREGELETCRRIADSADSMHEQTSSNDAEKSKQHPDIVLAVHERLDHLSPQDAVADTPHDAKAACKGGLCTLGVLCGGFSEQWLRDAGCIAVYRDPADLLVRLAQSLVAQEPAS